MRLQWQFNLVVIPLVVVPLFTLGVMAFQHLLQSERNKLMGTMNEKVAHLSQKINVNFARIQSNLELLSSDGVMTRYALVEDEYSRYRLYQKGLLERFKRYQLSFSIYEEIRFILPDGYEDSHWMKKGYENVSEEESTQPWFPRLSKTTDDIQNFISTNIDTDNQSLYSFKPLLLRDYNIEGYTQPETLRGYLATTVNLNWLKSSLQELLADSDGYVAIKDKEDKIIFSYGSEQFLALENSKEGISTIKSSQGLVYQVKMLTSLGYSLIFLQSEAQAFNQAGSLAVSIVVITFFSIALTLFVLVILLRKSILRPLHQLLLASRDIGSGNLNTNVSKSGCDELNELALGFNDMAKSLQNSDEQIRFIAYHDSLTRLPNRRMFQFLLSNTIAASERSKECMALFFLDIDNFKTINDSLGHDVGDALLKIFAQRIADCLREEDALLPPEGKEGLAHEQMQNDLVARLGGDEFTILLPHLKQATDASFVAQRIISAMENEFFVGEYHFKVTTSIGITIYPDNGTTPDELIKHADIAMYHAKEQGKNNFQYYSDELNEAIADRVDRENELRHAIESHHMEVYFQAQVSLPNRDIYGFEALVRWNHPTKGMISPLHFISLAEETGMIIELGKWILYESCQIAVQWLKMGKLDFRISVNISSRQFERQDLASLVKQVLEETGLPAKYLTLELTESVIMSSRDKNLVTLAAIKKLGVQISLDDFGTGYSSLSYLRTFPVDTLKIDQQFIKEARHEPEVRAIISAIVIMAHALELNVVAEGVEEEQELDYLASIDCDVIQGYYFNKPMPATEVVAFIDAMQAKYLSKAN